MNLITSWDIHLDVLIELIVLYQGEKFEGGVLKVEPIVESIVEGGVYQLSNFLIIHNTGAQRFTSHGYRLILDSRSSIVPAEDDRIPAHGWSFFHIENVMIVGDKFGYLVGKTFILCYKIEGFFVVY